MLNMCLPLLHFRKRKLNQVESNIIVCGAVHLCLWKPSDLRTNTELCSIIRNLLWEVAQCVSMVCILMCTLAHVVCTLVLYLKPVVAKITFGTVAQGTCKHVCADRVVTACDLRDIPWDTGSMLLNEIWKRMCAWYWFTGSSIIWQKHCAGQLTASVWGFFFLVQLLSSSGVLLLLI